MVVSSDLPTELRITPKTDQEPHFQVLAPGTKATTHSASEIQNVLRQKYTFFPPKCRASLAPQPIPIRWAHKWASSETFTSLNLYRSSLCASHTQHSGFAMEHQQHIWCGVFFAVTSCPSLEQGREGGVHLHLFTGLLPTVALGLWFSFGPQQSTSRSPSPARVPKC